MKIGCCLDMSYYDQLVQTGYETIALAAKDVASWDDETLELYRDKLENGPLERVSLNSFCTPDLRLCGKGYDLDKVREYINLVAARGAKLGFKYIGIGAPGSRNLQPGDHYESCWKQFVETLQMLCDVASNYNMEILMESVCSLECNFITTTREALRLIRETNRPNLHLVYDIYHEMMEEQPIDVIFEAASDIKVVHIAEDEAGKRAYLKQKETEKYAQYWIALQKVGYNGEWNLEAFVGLPEEELSKSMNIMCQLQKTYAE